MLLLDSHVALWWMLDPDRLGSTVLEEIATIGDRAYVSAASTWEIELKRHAGRLELPTDFATLVDEEGFSHLPITAVHAVEASSLPQHHRDPFDRMLVAQARVERLTLVTADGTIPQYDVSILRP